MCVSVFTFLRMMPCIPQSSSSGRRDRADPRLQPDLCSGEITVTKGFSELLGTKDVAQSEGIETLCPLALPSHQRQNYCLICCSEVEQDLRTEPACKATDPATNHVMGYSHLDGRRVQPATEVPGRWENTQRSSPWQERERS